MDIQTARYIRGIVRDHDDVLNIREKMKSAGKLEIVMHFGERKETISIDARILRETYFRDLMIRGLDLEIERLAQKLKEL